MTTASPSRNPPSSGSPTWTPPAMSTPRNGICPAGIADVRGSVVALLDNGNDTSNFFFQGLSQILQEEYGVSQGNPGNQVHLHQSPPTRRPNQ